MPPACFPHNPVVVDTNTTHPDRRCKAQTSHSPGASRGRRGHPSDERVTPRSYAVSMLAMVQVSVRMMLGIRWMLSSTK